MEVLKISAAYQQKFIHALSDIISYRPVNQWNKGKQSEFSDRKSFDANGKLKCEIKSC